MAQVTKYNDTDMQWMNNIERAGAQTKPDTRSLSEWIKYEEFIDAQLSLVGEENIKELECYIKDEKINYGKSKFNDFLSGSIKLLYRDHTTAPLENMPHLPIFTSVFKDDRAHFLPYAHKILSVGTTNLLDDEYHDADPKIEAIFSGDYDAAYDTLDKEDKNKNYLNNI